MPNVYKQNIHQKIKYQNTFVFLALYLLKQVLYSTVVRKVNLSRHL